MNPTGTSGRVRLVAEGHRVTTFELFFDLVFVFAITQVTAYLTESHDAVGIARGILVLALIWWSWSSYAWLGNQAQADVGLMRGGMVVAMIAIFVVALATPEAWDDLPGGLDGPLVLAVAYIVVRGVHMGLYFAAARGDEGLWRQLRLTFAPLGTGVVLLVAGAVVGGAGQTALWALALAADWSGTYVTSRRGGGWRLHSLDHWVERHGLVVILALGESIVAIGGGAADHPVSWSLLGAVAFAILIATALWWLYFDMSAGAARQALARLEGVDRVRTAISAYTYAHFVVIAGIVVSAFGIEEAIAHTVDGESLDASTAGALCVGPAAYLVGVAIHWFALAGKVKVARLLSAVALVIAWPVAAEVPALAALATVLAVLSALVAYETAHYSDQRAALASAAADR
jgi:low temperature requirement protein LtrA